MMHYVATPNIELKEHLVLNIYQWWHNDDFGVDIVVVSSVFVDVPFCKLILQKKTKSGLYSCRVSVGMVLCDAVHFYNCQVRCSHQEVFYYFLNSVYHWQVVM